MHYCEIVAEEGVDNLDRKIMMDSDEEGKHLVLPGEDLEHLSETYSTSPEAFIKRNRCGITRIIDLYRTSRLT